MFFICNQTREHLYLDGVSLEPNEVKRVFSLNDAMARCVDIGLVSYGPAYDLMTPEQIFQRFPIGSWYNFDLATLWELSNETTPALDGAPVGAWSDKYGDAYPMSQGSTPNKPLVDVAERAVRFVGNTLQGQELSYSGGTIATLDKDITVMAVVKAPVISTLNDRQMLTVANFTSNDDYVTLRPRWTGNNVRLQTYNYYSPRPGLAASAASAPEDSFMVISGTRKANGDMINLALNGEVVAAGPLASGPPVTAANMIAIFSSQLDGADMLVRDMIWFAGNPPIEVIKGYALYGATL